MEHFYQSQQQQQLPIPMKNSPVHDLFPGDSPEVLPVEESPLNSSDISDSESGVTGSSTTTSSSTSSCRLKRDVFREVPVVELREGQRIYEVIRRRFLYCLSPVEEKMTEVVSIRQNDWSAYSSQARLQAFQIHSRAVANKNGGNPNVKFAWYGNQRERIEKIMAHGFSYRELQPNLGAIFLSPGCSASSSVEDSIPDEDGLRHVLLCRVIIGKPELVQPESAEFNLNSEEFDSGVVGEFESPNKYLVWSNNMNTHILPECIVSFRVSSFPSLLSGESKTENRTLMPNSPSISFTVLISALGRFLPSDAISLMNKHHKDYKERKISRPELIQRAREIVGDKLLIAVINSCRGAKELKSSMGFLCNRKARK